MSVIFNDIGKQVRGHLKAETKASCKITGRGGIPPITVSQSRADKVELFSGLMMCQNDT